MRFFLSSILMMLISLPVAAYVATPDAVGTYQGNWSGSDCEGPSQGTFTLVISADGTLVMDTIDTQGHTEVLTGGVLSVVSGSPTTPGSFTAELFGDEHGVGDVITDKIDFSGTTYFDESGKMTNATFSATTTYVDIYGSCPGTGSGSLSTTIGSSAITVNPAVAPSSEAIHDINTLNQFVTTFTDAVGSRVQSALSNKLGRAHGLRKLSRNSATYETQIGLSAGDDFEPVLVGVWGSYSYTSFENDFSRLRYDGRRLLFMGGADFSPSDEVVVGVALGYEDADINTDFNGGEAESNGFTIAPYVGVIIDDTWSLDISAGYSKLNTDQYRTQFGARITSDVDTTRWFFSGNLNGFTQRGNWLLTGRFGAMYAFSKDGEFTESNGLTTLSRKDKLAQISLGGEAAYQMDNLEPFIGATFSYDMTATELELLGSPQPSNDRTDLLLTGGMRFYGDSGMSGIVDISKRVGREDFDEASLNFYLRWDFN